MIGYIYYTKIDFCDENTLPELDKDYYYSDVSKPDNAIFVLVEQ